MVVVITYSSERIAGNISTYLWVKYVPIQNRAEPVSSSVVEKKKTKYVNSIVNVYFTVLT